ncbi:hypothetical protein SeLEV6574_g01308, partial [Synchytrium endobioticum]
LISAVDRHHQQAATTKCTIVAIGMGDFSSAKSRHVMFIRGYLEHDERPTYLKPPSKDKNTPMKRKADEGGADGDEEYADSKIAISMPFLSSSPSNKKYEPLQSYYMDITILERPTSLLEYAAVVLGGSNATIVLTKYHYDQVLDAPSPIIKKETRSSRAPQTDAAISASSICSRRLKDLADFLPAQALSPIKPVPPPPLSDIAFFDDTAEDENLIPYNPYISSLDTEGDMACPLPISKCLMMGASLDVQSGHSICKPTIDHVGHVECCLVWFGLFHGSSRHIG